MVPIESRITILHHQKVILDTALAELYGIPVKRLNQTGEPQPEAVSC